MLTLNQIKIILLAWFNNHAQINSTYYEDDFDFNAERNILYPVCNIEYLNSVLNDKVTSHIFKIVIGDITEPDNHDMEDEVFSDSLQVAEDFFTYLQNFEGFMFNKNATLNKFVDDTGDRVTGVVFTISLGVIRPQNWCDTPTKTGI